MSDLKNSVAAREKDKVRQLQFEEAIRLKLDIQEWTDIQKKFAKDNSREIMEKAYHIVLKWYY